ncbi:MAG: nickel-dependent lactate racemase [Firmicutes bacterium]|nr:nickel-dependent lactate racemase [Bacillota bacterium]
MRTISLGYDRQQIEFELDKSRIIKVLNPNVMEISRSPEEEILDALKNPIASSRLRSIVKPGEKIAIVTSDITRPFPTALVLPFVLEELKSARVSLDDVTVVLGLGIHRPHTDEERERIIGMPLSSIRCLDSDPGDCVHLGQTRRGTPVDVFRPVAEADRRICLGNIEYHYFAGYSGGVKAIFPGVSTHQAIQNNHSMMVEETAMAGVLEGNPVREDIEEITEYLPVDFILNVVLDDKKQVVRAVAGHHQKAHRQGCRFLDQLYQVQIPRLGEVVITSPGGFPKDLNLYQAQKALDNAKYAVKPGGIIILAASCKEGLGEPVFENWVMEAEKPQDLLDRLGRRFELGGHKAAAIAMVLKRSRVFLVSDLEDSLVERLGCRPFKNCTDAVNQALREMGEDAGVIVMPAGGSILPRLR